MAGVPDERESERFFFGLPEKLNGPFPDLAYLRENRLVFVDESRDIGITQIGTWCLELHFPPPAGRPGALPSSRRSCR